MPRYKVTGSFYEPGEFAGKDGYIRFWDVIEADTGQDAIEMALEDYGDFNHVTCEGEIVSKADEKEWLAKNPS